MSHGDTIQGLIDSGDIQVALHRGSSSTGAVRALQTLPHELGFDAELKWTRYGADGNYGGNTVRAVNAFARQQGIPSDGERLTSALARRIVANLRPRYGDEWSTVTLTPAAAYSKLRTREIQRGGKTWVAVIDGRQEKRFRRFKKGLFTSGNCPPLRFIETSGAKLRAAGLTDSAIAVMVSVAENEGSLDAINTWDNAFLSFGMFQWTAGTTNAKGELAAVLERLKASAPEAFAEYFGCHGLGVTDSNGVYGHLTLKGRRLSSAALKEQLRAPEWAFRFWLAGQDPEVQAVEIQHALSRLEGFYNTDRYTVRGGHRVAELVSSEYGVALLLDNHVNRPAYVKGCLGGALKQTGLPPPQDWGTEEEARLLKAYLRIRRGYGSSPMTDAAKRAAVTRRYLDDGTVSAERHSFQLGRG